MMSHVLHGACEGLGRITKILKATNAIEKSMDTRVATITARTGVLATELR